MKKSFSEFFKVDDIKRILVPERSITAIIGELRRLADKVVENIEKNVYLSREDFLSAISENRSELNEWLGEVEVEDNVLCIERCVTGGLRRSLLDKRTGKLPSFYDEIENKYLSLKGVYTGVLNPLCIICHVILEHIVRSVAIPGAKVRIFPLSYRSGYTGKRVYVEKVIELAERKTGINREKVDSMLDKYECLYYLDFVG